MKADHPDPGPFQEVAPNEPTESLLQLLHDVRSALTPICCGHELTLKQHPELPPDVREELEMGLIAVMRVVEIIRAHEARAGGPSVVCNATDAATVLQETVRIARMGIQHRVRITVIRPESLVLVPYESDLIFRVLTNLLTNAIQAIGPACGEIEALCAVVDDPNAIPAETLHDYTLRDPPHLLLRITDTGCGMDPLHVIQAHRDPFTTKPSGHGRGLSMVREFVRSAGGGLHIASERGKGTIVSLYLPLSDSTGPSRHVSGIHPITDPPERP